MTILSLLMLLGSAGLLTDLIAFQGEYYFLLPEFTATAASLVGAIIAALNCRYGGKPKKKRGGARALLWLNILVCIAATVIWVLRLLGNGAPA